MALPEAVLIPFVSQFIDDEGGVQANETMEHSASDMLDELARWASALRVRRHQHAPLAA